MLEFIEGEPSKFALVTGDSRIYLKASSVDVKHSWVKTLRLSILEKTTVDQKTPTIMEANGGTLQSLLSVENLTKDLHVPSPYQSPVPVRKQSDADESIEKSIGGESVTGFEKVTANLIQSHSRYTICILATLSIYAQYMYTTKYTICILSVYSQYTTKYTVCILSVYSLSILYVFSQYTLSILLSIPYVYSLSTCILLSILYVFSQYTLSTCILSVYSQYTICIY